MQIAVETGVAERKKQEEFILVLQVYIYLHNNWDLFNLKDI